MHIADYNRKRRNYDENSIQVGDYVLDPMDNQIRKVVEVNLDDPDDEGVRDILLELADGGCMYGHEAAEVYLPSEIAGLD